MKNLILLLGMFLAGTAHAVPPSPAASANAVNVIPWYQGGYVDPQVTAVDGPVNAIYVEQSTNSTFISGIWQKADDGLSTNWFLYGGPGFDGSPGAPIVLDGSAPLMVPCLGGTSNQVIFVAGSGGPVTMPDPPIVGGCTGQLLTIYGTSNVNTVTFVDTGASGDFYSNGNRTLGQGNSLSTINVSPTSPVTNQYWIQSAIP